MTKFVKVISLFVVLSGLIAQAANAQQATLYLFDAGYIGVNPQFIRSFSSISYALVGDRRTNNPGMMTVTIAGALTPVVEQCLAQAREMQSQRAAGRNPQLYLRGDVTSLVSANGQLNITISGDLSCLLYSQFNQ